mmetsp:Transcript_27389/g.70570  ORF Transcript_27389/g.70570 Transcript_27389/m.70570 type:complete len:83 (+) Transcript_27389:640-888(+)
MLQHYVRALGSQQVAQRPVARHPGYVGHHVRRTLATSYQSRRPPADMLASQRHLRALEHPMQSPGAGMRKQGSGQLEEPTSF